MSKVLQKLNRWIIESGTYTKFFMGHTPGDRIAPAKSQPSELRYDAGEEIEGGYRNVYLQVNTEAKNTALKKYRAKNGTHSNIATLRVKIDTPEDQQKDVIYKVLEQGEEVFKEKVG